VGSSPDRNGGPAQTEMKIVIINLDSERPPRPAHFDLSELLALLPASAAQYVWRIAVFDGVTRPGANWSYEKIREHLNNGVWSLSWQDLFAIGAATAQTIWCSITGTYEGHLIHFEAQDSSRWVVGSDASTLAAIKLAIPSACAGQLSDFDYWPEEARPERGA